MKRRNHARREEMEFRRGSTRGEYRPSTLRFVIRSSELLRSDDDGVKETANESDLLPKGREEEKRRGPPEFLKAERLVG